eukprot:1404772-Prymnesium_polylepis.1
MEEVFPGGSEGPADAAADFEAQIKALASSAALIQGVLSEQENQGLTDKQWATEYLPSYVAHVSSMFSAPTAVGGADGNEDVSSGTAAAQASVAPPPPAEAFTETSDGFKSEMIGKGVSWHELEKALSVSEVHQVPSTEKMAARAYTGASPAIHRDLNSKLRNAGGPEPPPPDYKHCTHYLQRAVQALPLPAGVTSESILYRGQDGLHGIAYNHGDIVVWPAFTSVSTERGVAEAFSRGSVMFEISGVSEEVGGSVAAISIFKNEAEVVLQAGTRLRVVESAVSGSWLVVRLEVIRPEVGAHEGAAVEAARKAEEEASKVEAEAEAARIAAEEAAAEAAEEAAEETAEQVAEGAAEATAEEAAEATAEEAAEPGASEQSMALVDAQPTGLAH